MLFWSKKSTVPPSKQVILASDSEISSDFSRDGNSKEEEFLHGERTPTTSCSDLDSDESERRVIPANPHSHPHLHVTEGMQKCTLNTTFYGTRMPHRMMGSQTLLPSFAYPPVMVGRPSRSSDGGGGRRPPSSLFEEGRRRPVPRILPSRSSHPSMTLLSGEALVNFPTASSGVNILVLGPLQGGKSTFINAFRAALAGNQRWPSAPVGRCGFHGTTSLEPFPDRLPNPSWFFIDTPGYCYEVGDEELIRKLVEGLPWGTRLVGSDAIPLDEVKALAPVPSNRCRQCVVVIPAIDLVEDAGWVQNLRWQSRYIPARDAEGVVLHLKKLFAWLQALLGNVAGFIVISKMDRVGGCENRFAREVILDILETCVPINRIFFSEFPVEKGSVRSKSNYLLDNSTRESLRQLHDELHNVLDWIECMKS